jgi:hypothetical protein
LRLALRRHGIRDQAAATLQPLPRAFDHARIAEATADENRIRIGEAVIGLRRSPLHQLQVRRAEIRRVGFDQRLPRLIGFDGNS